jgi:hypothetical protein
LTPEILVRFALVLLKLVIVPAVPVILVIVPEVLFSVVIVPAVPVILVIVPEVVFSVAIVPIPLTFNCVALVIPSIDVPVTLSVESAAPTILTDLQSLQYQLHLSY